MSLEPTEPTLTVMTWNLAFGYGEGSEGQTYQPRPRQAFLDRLDAMARVIRLRKVDILLAQEVDFASARSHFIHEAEYLSARTGLSHFREAVSWDARYVPYPFWPPRRHFGRILSGGAILSRYPLVSSETHLLPKPSRNSRIYNAFYLYRYFQVASVRIAGRERAVINAHFEAFDRVNREEHSVRLAEWLRTSLPRLDLLVLGGDFNSVPPDAIRKSGFRDEPGADFSQETTVARLLEIPGIHSIDVRESTFPASHPTRRLDHLLLRAGTHALSAEVVTEAGELSDHLPLVAALRAAPSVQ